MPGGGGGAGGEWRRWGWWREQGWAYLAVIWIIKAKIRRNAKIGLGREVGSDSGTKKGGGACPAPLETETGISQLGCEMTTTRF